MAKKFKATSYSEESNPPSKPPSRPPSAPTEYSSYSHSSYQPATEPTPDYSPPTERKKHKVVGFWLFMVFAVGIYASQLFLLRSPDGLPEPAPLDDTEYAPPVKAKPRPRPTQTTSTPSPSSHWNGASNGHTWNRATYAQKKWICDKMASVSNKGGTSAYYMNFYDSFYGSAATDSTSMSDASRLAEVGL